MKIAYAFRRTAFYPYDGGTGWEVPPSEVRAAYLQQVRACGFSGIEIGLGQGVANDEAAIRALRSELDAAGVPCAAVRGGGGFASPRLVAQNRQRFRDAVRMASWIGSNLVNSALTVPTGNPPGEVGGGVGKLVSPGGSKTASETDYEVTARELRAVADFAADLGVTLSLELHQHSIADNSWGCLHLLELIDRPNVGINPDLGNLFWNYYEPEERPEAAIVALAPKSAYWHCKQLLRVQIPELERAYYMPVPIPDGEIDYRFAVSAMLAAGYDGYLAIEGVRGGDQLHGDGRSVAYLQALIAQLQAQAAGG